MCGLCHGVGLVPTYYDNGALWRRCSRCYLFNVADCDVEYCNFVSQCFADDVVVSILPIGSVESSFTLVERDVQVE